MRLLQIGAFTLFVLAVAGPASAQTFSADSAANPQAPAAPSAAGGTPAALPVPNERASYQVPIELKPALAAQAAKAEGGPVIDIGHVQPQQ